jgi:guanylate kinase
VGEYSGNLYGTLREEIDRIHAAGHHAVLDIDLQGARQLRGNSAAAVEVFVLPPSGASLADRLVRRNTETAEALRRRLERAAEEILAAGEYDYVIVNDDLEHAVQQVDAIIEAESRRAHRPPDLAGTLQELRQAVETEARRHPAVNAGS